jgi:hypothetical protein
MLWRMNDQSAYPCPVCHTLTTLEQPCPGCGRGPDPNAAAVITLDGRIGDLKVRVEQAKLAYDGLAAELTELYRQRENHATLVRAAVAAEQTVNLASRAPVPPWRQPGTPAATPSVVVMPAAPGAAAPSAASPSSGVAPAPAPRAATPSAASPSAAPQAVPVGLIPPVAGAPAVAQAGAQAAGRGETTPKTVQNLLFVLGGLLLGIAAIVFTAVAWVNYGLTGQAVILGGVTLVTLAVPPLVRRRGLQATAETFAALGMLLVILDGYAAWAVDLAGIQSAWDGGVYAGVVCALAAVAGFGYGSLTGVRSPLFLGLIAAQPVLPLSFSATSIRLPLWALIFAVVALGNILLARWAPRPVQLRLLAFILHVVALIVAAAIAVPAWFTDGTFYSSAAVIGTSLVLAAGATVPLRRLVSAPVTPSVSASATGAGGLPRREPGQGLAAAKADDIVADGYRGLAGAVMAFALVAGIVRPFFERLSVEGVGVAWAGVALLLAFMVWGLSNYLPGVWLTGAKWGTVAALGIPALAGVGWALGRGALTAAAAVPWWHQGDMELLRGPYPWEMPLTLVLSVGGLAFLTQRRFRKIVVIAGVTVLALALPGAPPLAIWAPSLVDILVAAALLLWALMSPGRLGLIAKSLAALFLVGHALLAGQATPVLASVVMTIVVVLALTVSYVAPKGLLRPAVTIDGRHELGGAAAALADLLLPWLGFTVVAALGGDLTASWRVLVLLVLVMPFLGTGRQFRGYHIVAGLIVALYPLWPVLPGNESPAIYAALSVVAMTVAGFRSGWGWLKWAPAVPAALCLIWAGSSWYPLMFGSFENLAHVWAGGASTPEVSLAHAVALTLLLAPVVVTRSVKLIGVAAIVPVLAWLAVAQVPWPVLPAIALIGGLAALVVAAWRERSELLAVLGVILTLSGLTGALPEQWSTITALGLISVAMTAIGVKAGLPGWIPGAIAKVLLALAIGETANLRPEVTAYLVLLVAALLMGIGYFVAKGSRTALEASAHSAALVALALTSGAPHHTAGVLAIWGVVTGLTALSRQPVARATVAAVLVSAAWITLLRAERVETLEAYTLPVALLAVAAGVLASRRRAVQARQAALTGAAGQAAVAGLTSWVAYGPALAAALLPSLGAVLIEPGGVIRRLALGLGALVVVIAGAVGRKQAAFLIGGVTLLVLAMHELALVWQLLPAWIPLGVIGLVLVGLAITYERRLRDLSRLRGAVSRMT